MVCRLYKAGAEGVDAAARLLQSGRASTLTSLTGEALAATIVMCTVASPLYIICTAVLPLLITDDYLNHPDEELATRYRCLLTQHEDMVKYKRAPVSALVP